MPNVASSVQHPEFLRIEGQDDIYLRLIQPGEAEALYAVIEADREHLQTYQQWAQDATLESTQQSIREALQDQAVGKSLRYRIVDAKSDAVIGNLTFYNRSSDVAYLGYWITKNSEGHGLAFAAVNRLLDYGFADWGLQAVRLEIAPGNERSEQLAARLGAQPTGEFTMGSVPEHPIKCQVWEIHRG